MTQPQCFVLMPIGRKVDAATGVSIDFDAVYYDLIKPAIRAAGLDPIRAADEMAGGIVYRSELERLIVCDYAVADLTLANPNVLYQLGIRDAVRPHSTVLIFASGTHLPLDVRVDQGLSGVSYVLSSTGAPAEVEATRDQLTKRLEAPRDAPMDSLVFQLTQGSPYFTRPTDAFREQAQNSEMWKERLTRARGEGIDAVRAAEHELGDLHQVETGILLDLFLSYRAVAGWEEMIRLMERMPQHVAETAMVREQAGLALNRLGRRAEAERILLDLIDERGPSNETYGILGRVYKDRWADASAAGETVLAAGLLAKAIDTYLKGFETDWRDTYSGINTVTLMELRTPPDPRREQLITVVTYANERRLASGQAEYWDYAAQLELAVLAKDEPGAESALAQALAMGRESWELQSTANNLKIIRNAREPRGDNVSWAHAIEQELLRQAGQT